MKTLLFCLAATLPFLVPALSAAEVVELIPSKDNTIFDFAADTLSSNGSGPSLFAGRNSQGNRRRALIAFPVADSLPPKAVIDSVEFRLNVVSTSDGNERTMYLQRLGEDWGEGASWSAGGRGDTPRPGDATWIHRFFPDQFWAPGGGFIPISSALFLVGDEGVYSVDSWTDPGLVADVQHWLDQPASNFGWILLGDESESTTVRRFASRENPNPEVRPRLVIHYSPPVPVRPVTWGAVKAGKP